MSIGMESKPFKSPLRKLLAFFQRSRDRWKQKYMDAQKEIKRLSNQRRAVEKSRAEWRAKFEQLKAEREPQKGAATIG